MASSAFDSIISFMTVASNPSVDESYILGRATGDNYFVGTNSSQKLERSILDLCQQRQHPAHVEPTDRPCSDFFQQKGSIDFKDYIRLKQEERLAVIQYHAAVKIQALWRGFLLRSNWKIVEASAIKIQSWIRGHLARKKFQKMVEERDAQVRRELMEKAAVKIQAAWRGYISRKNKLDFKKYKSIQEKNEALKRSIARINELESALLKTLQGGDSLSDGASTFTSSHTLPTPVSSISSKTFDPCAEPDTRLSFFLNNMITPSVESFLVEKIPEYVNELSDSRIAELYAYMANMESEIKKEKELEKLVNTLGGPHKLNYEQLRRLEESRRVQKERAHQILNLAKLVMTGPLKKKLEMERMQREGLLPKEDSVDDMFPTVPERPDIVLPDPVKVQALKDAIRMFRQKGEAKEDRDLKKKHVLLRTKTTPGIYSDIYTTELTKIEQKLKSLKFWKGSILAEKLAMKNQIANERRLKRLFTHALKLTNKRLDLHSQEEEEEDEQETVAEEALPVDLYQEYLGEVAPEDDDYDDEDVQELDYQNERGGSRRMSRVQYPSNPKPPPPTPAVNNEEDAYESGHESQVD